MAAIADNDIEKRSQLLCSPCKRKEKNKEADKYCADCNDFYCSDCVKFHEEIPAVSGHKILDRGEFKDEESGGLPVALTERCDRHRFRPIDVYCENHDEVGCSTCIAIDHRSCQGVFYVPEYVLDHDPKPQCLDVQKKMTGVINDINHHLEIRQREIKRLFKRKEEEVEKIKQFRTDINHKLDDMEKKSIDVIEEKYKSLIKRFKDEIATLTTFQKNIHSSQENIKSSLSNLSQMFVGMKLANLVTERSGKEVKEQTKAFTRCDTVFEGKQELISMICDMDILGEIHEKPGTHKLEGKREINIKHDSDSASCDISSTCILNDGSVVIADHNIQTLKRLDGSSFQVVEICKLSESPWQICRVNKEVAVSSGSLNINFVTTDGALKVAREMKTDHVCYGLGYNNGIIYVTDTKESVFVYNQTGTKLTRYYQDHSGQRLFANIYSLTVSSDGEKIYVADYPYNIVVLNKEGELQGKYKSSKLIKPREICETESGDIIVCGESSNNIIQFSPNGEVLGEILQSEGIEGFCRSISLDCKSSRLIVARNSKDIIDVYNMI